MRDDKQHMIVDTLQGFERGKDEWSVEESTELSTYIISSQGRKELSCLNEKQLDVLLYYILHMSDCYFEWTTDQFQAILEQLISMDNIVQRIKYEDLYKILLDHFSFPIYSKISSSDVLSNFFKIGGLSTKADGSTEVRVNETGQSILHVAAEEARNGWETHQKGLLRAVLKGIPQGVTLKDKFGRLPLHNIIYGNADYLDNGAHFDDEDVLNITELLRYHPNAAKVKDNDGLLPFHIFYVFHPVTKDENTYSKTRQLLYEAYPLALKESFSYSLDAVPAGTFQTTLHYKCENAKDPYDISDVIFFIENCPETLFLLDSSGRAPFHSLLLQNDDPRSDESNPKFISELLEQMEQNKNVMTVLSTLRDWNGTGNNLLHILSKRTFDHAMSPNQYEFKSLSVSSITQQQLFEWFVLRFPSYVCQKNTRGELPIHILLKNNNHLYSNNELELLISAYDSYCTNNNMPNELHYFHSSTELTTLLCPLYIASSQDEPNPTASYLLIKRLVEKNLSAFSTVAKA